MLPQPLGTTTAGYNHLSRGPLPYCLYASTWVGDHCHLCQSCRNARTKWGQKWTFTHLLGFFTLFKRHGDLHKKRGFLEEQPEKRDLWGGLCGGGKLPPFSSKLRPRGPPLIELEGSGVLGTREGLAHQGVPWWLKSRRQCTTRVSSSPPSLLYFVYLFMRMIVRCLRFMWMIYLNI